eukprot:PhF_6_TR44476/c0_g1_i1/m.68477
MMRSRFLRATAFKMAADATGASSAASSTSSSTIGSGPKYDPYFVLGIRSGAPAHELRDRYHTLMQQYHPEMASDGIGDIEKMQEIDKAYILVTQAPTQDKRYRNLISDTQRMYYNVLPEWIAKNLDDMPRYWAWARWRLNFTYFALACSLVCLVMGKMYKSHPNWIHTAVFCFIVDCMFHTMFFPMIMFGIFFRAFGDTQQYSMAWLNSPKNFLRRQLDY